VSCVMVSCKEVVMPLQQIGQSADAQQTSASTCAQAIEEVHHTTLAQLEEALINLVHVPCCPPNEIKFESERYNARANL